MLTRCLLTSSLLAATPAHFGVPTNQTETIFAPILRTERTGPGVVRVVYDLRGVIGTAFAVGLAASDDGGQTFAVRPQALTGDVGPRVSPGAEKSLVWDSTKDIDDLQADRYVFRVRVSPSQGESATIPPHAAFGATAQAAGRGAAGGARGSGTTAAAKKGGLGKGALIGIAGGAAASLGVAVAKGQDSGQAVGGVGGNGQPRVSLGTTTSVTLR